MRLCCGWQRTGGKPDGWAGGGFGAGGERGHEAVEAVAALHGRAIARSKPHQERG